MTVSRMLRPFEEPSNVAPSPKQKKRPSLCHNSWIAKFCADDRNTGYVTRVDMRLEIRFLLLDEMQEPRHRSILVEKVDTLGDRERIRSCRELGHGLPLCSCEPREIGNHGRSIAVRELDVFIRNTQNEDLTILRRLQFTSKVKRHERIRGDVEESRRKSVVLHPDQLIERRCVLCKIRWIPGQEMIEQKFFVCYACRRTEDRGYCLVKMLRNSPIKPLYTGC